MGGDVDADLVDECGHSDGEAVVPKINLKNVLIGRIDRVLNHLIVKTHTVVGILGRHSP